MVRLGITVGLLVGSALLGCARKPDPPLPIGANATSTRAQGPQAEHKEAPAPPIDWTKARAFRPLASNLPTGMDFCSTLLRYDIAEDKFLLRDGTHDVIVSGTAGWVEPLGYSSVLHDLCEAKVRLEPSPPPMGSTWVQYKRPSSDSLHQLFRTGQTLYWMSERGRGCVPIRVKEMIRPPRGRKRDPKQVDTTLGGFASIEVPDDALWGRLDVLGDGTTIPFAAVMPDEGNHGFIFMGTWQTREDRPFFKCQCERLLRFMNLEAHHLEVLPHRFASDPKVGDRDRREVPVQRQEASHYDAGDVEKWFWDKPSCEDERKAALERIVADGRQTTKSGFYSGYSSFEDWYGFNEADRQ